jgi:hypothetical protein
LGGSGSGGGLPAATALRDSASLLSQATRHYASSLPALLARPAETAVVAPPVQVLVAFGLGHRIAALVSSECFGRQIGERVRVFWQRDRTCFASASELFDLSAFEHVDLQSPNALPEPEFQRVWVRSLSPSSSESPEYFATSRIPDPSLPGPLHPSEFHIEAMRHVVITTSYAWYARSQPTFLRILRSLRPEPAIRAAVDEFFDQLGLERDVVGVHVRRTDNANAIKYSPLSAYVRAMRDFEPRETVFVLLSDDASVAGDLAALLPECRIVEPGFPGPLGRDTLGGMRRAAAEFFTLARCPVVVHSAHSAFSSMAVLFGGAAEVRAQSNVYA